MLFNLTDPIEKTKFSFQICNWLRSTGVCTLGDLLTFDPEKLFEATRQNESNYQEVQKFLNKSLNKDWEKFYFLYKEIADYSITLIRGADGSLRKDVPINALNLSPKIYPKLDANGYKGAAQLIGISPDILLLIMDKKSMHEVLQAVESLCFERVPSSFLSTDANYLCSEFVDKISEAIKVDPKKLYQELLSHFKYASRNKEDINLKQLFYIPYLREAVKQKITLFSSNISLKRDISEIIHLFPEGTIECAIIKDILNELEADKKITILENTTILKYIKLYLSEKHQNILLMRLQGQTLAEIGAQIGTSSEAVRQILNSSLKQKPIVAENKYIRIFNKYDFSKDDFCYIFDEDESVYHYLMLISKKRNVLSISEKNSASSLKHFLANESYSDEIKQRIEQIVYKDYIVIGDEKIYRNRPNIINYVLRTHFQEGGLFDDFAFHYNQFLKSFKLTTVASLKLMPHNKNASYFANKILLKSGRKFRYYDFDSYDFSELWQEIMLEQYHDTTLPTFKLFKEHTKIMRKYDIRDEYELHDLLKKLCRIKPISNIIFKRIPIIKFENKDKVSNIS